MCPTSAAGLFGASLTLDESVAVDKQISYGAEIVVGEEASSLGTQEE